MSGQYDTSIRHYSVTEAREIKASAVYTYLVNGITLDGSKFLNNELVVAGTCLARNTTTGLYEKYSEPVPGTFRAGYSDPTILDTSVRFETKDDGANPNVVVGACLATGAVYRGMCLGLTAAFEAKTPRIGYVQQ